MNKLSTLGPKGTFSDQAANVFLTSSTSPYEIIYYDSIPAALEAIGTTCELGVLPIENLSEGFVQLTIDSLVQAELYILSEIILPVRFSFVANCSPEEGLSKLFVQFVAKGQCSKFISSLGKVDIQTTQSNIESLDRLKSEDLPSGAIVPAHSVENGGFLSTRENIHDRKNNATRFVVLGKYPIEDFEVNNRPVKTSIIVYGNDDRPGLLQSIIAPISSRGINLVSLTSRPNGEEFGKYNFHIDIGGSQNDPLVADALHEIQEKCKARIIGSYPLINHHQI